METSWFGHIIYMIHHIIHHMERYEGNIFRSHHPQWICSHFLPTPSPVGLQPICDGDGQSLHVRSREDLHQLGLLSRPI